MLLVVYSQAAFALFMHSEASKSFSIIVYMYGEESCYLLGGLGQAAIIK